MSSKGVMKRPQTMLFHRTSVCKADICIYVMYVYIYIYIVSWMRSLFIKGSLDEKLPSYELLKLLNNRFVSNRFVK